MFLISLRVIAGLWPPSQTVVKDGCESSICFKGQEPDVFNALQSVLNFTYTVKHNNIPGVKLANETWTGIIGKCRKENKFCDILLPACLIFYMMQ